MFIEREKQYHIADQISLWLSSAGYTCVDVDWDAPSRTLSVYIDHPNGISFEQCGIVSDLLIQNQELDLLIPCEFNLEISSPGVERPIRTAEHFYDAFQSKSKIDVKLVEKVQNRKKGVGLIQSIVGDDVTLKTDEGLWSFPRTKVLKAIRLVDWDQVAQLSEASESIN